MKSRSAILMAVLLAALLPTLLHAQPVVRHPDPATPLAERWNWGMQTAKASCQQGCWIGYSIQRWMAPDSYTGWHTDRRSPLPTLQMLVYGREVEPILDRRTVRRRAVVNENVLKEVALLFRLDPNDQTIRDVKISNISLPVDLEGRPLTWLGVSDQVESIPVLEKQYARTESAESKEALVVAVGIHDVGELIAPFLISIVESGEPEDVRKQAVFWLAEADDPKVLPALERTVRRDASDEVRKQAVFGISRIDTPPAEDLLIDLARNLEDHETREQAIFWLGQKASEKAVAGLSEIVENDPDVEIQKKAVFAISQLPEDEGVPRLIDIARTHRNPKVRQNAIFWLGESGDPRAVDVLVEIVRGK